MISRAIEGSITKISLIFKIRFHFGGYEWTDDWDLKSNNVTTILYLIFKSINPDKRIVVSNLKYEIERTALAKFVNNVKSLLDDMCSNYSIIIDKERNSKNYVRHIFRGLYLGPNSNFNNFIESSKNDWYTGTEFIYGYLIHNAT